MTNKFKFLTKNSFLKKVKSKGFIIGNLVVFLIIGVLVNIDSVISFFGGDFDSGYKIKIVDNAGFYTEVKDSFGDINSYVDKDITIKKVTDNRTNRESLKGTKDLLLIINKDTSNLFNVEIISDSYIDAVDYQAIVTCLNSAKQKIAIKDINLNDEDLYKLSSSVSVKRTFLDDSKTKQEEDSKTLISTLSIILVLPCFMLIVFLVQMIGAEINEEKSTRTMEIIIGNVSAKTHFFSKVLASNLFVLLQGFLLIIYAVIGFVIRKLTLKEGFSLGQTNNGFDINEFIELIKNSGVLNKLSYVLPLLLLIIILSFLAYSLLAGILASMTTNMENFQQLQTPLMVISAIGYYLIILSSIFPGATFTKVMSVIPLISISLAPSLILSGQIGVTTLILAILMLILLNFILIKYGLRIYKSGILNYSETGLWKKMFKAVKEE